MNEIYTDFDQLPISINADQLAVVLNISRSGAYELMKTHDFPTLIVKGRKLVRKDLLKIWMDRHTTLTACVIVDKPNGLQ